MRIVPLSNYRYCWSPNLSDLLSVATKMAHSSEDAIGAHLDSVGYCESGLAEAHAAGNEVMLYCDSCIAIPVDLLDEDPKGSEPSIILVT
jgi:hypothetical protein